MLSKGLQNDTNLQHKFLHMGSTPPQWAKLGGEAVLLDSSDFTKDPIHDFTRFVCPISCDCEFCLNIMHPLEYKPESVDLSDNQSLEMSHSSFALDSDV